MTELNYKELRAARRSRVDRDGNRLGKPPLDPITAAERKLQQNRRSALAQQRALQALARYFHDEYRSLFEQAMDEVNGERGPLPGDDQ